MSKNDEAALLERHRRLKLAQSAIEEELAVVEDALRELIREPTLDDMFFLEEVAPRLAGVRGGMSSAALRQALARTFGRIGEVKFRTFISRQKSRGNLMVFEQHRPVKWQITPTVAAKLARMGHGVVEQPEEWQKLVRRD